LPKPIDRGRKMNDDVELHRLLTAEAVSEENRRQLQSQMAEYVVNVHTLITKFESDSPGQRKDGAGKDSSLVSSPPCPLLRLHCETCPETDLRDAQRDTLVAALLVNDGSADMQMLEERAESQEEGLSNAAYIIEDDGEIDDGEISIDDGEKSDSQNSATSISSLIRRHLVVDYFHRQARLVHDCDTSKSPAIISSYLDQTFVSKGSQASQDLVSSDPTTSAGEECGNMEGGQESQERETDQDDQIGADAGHDAGKIAWQPALVVLDQVVKQWLQKLGLEHLSHRFAIESIDRVSLALLRF
jgi:hypothetical protein